MVSTRQTLALIFLSLALVGRPADAQTRGGSAIVALASDPTSFNPDLSTNAPDRMIGCITYQGLVEVSNDYKILPLLAKSWNVSPDGLTYSFDLTKALWHDGKPLISEDVKYTLAEVSAKFSGVFAPAGRAIASIETPAPDKVVIRLKQPFGPFLISLGCIQGAAIMPAHLFQGTDPLKNPASIAAPVGTGSFRFVDWKHGDSVRLARNDKYWEPGKPYLDEIIGKIIPQSTSSTQALRTGEIDYIDFLAASDRAVIAADPKLKVVDTDLAPEVSLAFFNTAHKPLDDKRVRQALFMATDRDYLFKNAFFGIGSVGTQPFSTEIDWAANPDIDYRKTYPFDVAKANALLDEAGLPKGAGGSRFSVRVVTRATRYPEFQQVTLALKSMWKAVGVDMVSDPMEDALITKAIYQDGNFDLFLNVYTSYSDPALGVARTFVSSALGKPSGNPTRYSNPEVDKLFEEGERATSFAQRGVFYRQAQAILARDLPVMTLRQYREIAGASKRLHGLWGVAQGNGEWSDAWLDP